MIPGEILETLFNGAFDSGFDISLHKALPTSDVNDYQRYLNTTEQLIVSSFRERKVRGLLRTAQSEYVALSGINTVTTTWSIEFADDIDNPKAMDAISKFIDEYNERVVVIEHNGESYTAGLVFNVPAGYTLQTINGTRYMQIVFTGRATVTDRSQLANESKIMLDGQEITGLVSWSIGMTATGENYNPTGDQAPLQHTTVQSLNTALSIDIHTVKDDMLAKTYTAAMINPASQLHTTGAIKTHSIVLTVGDETAIYPRAKLSDAQCSGSIGSYIVLSLRFMRD